MEKWNEICYLINRHIEKNSKEIIFQNEVENILEKLGWSRFKGEIILNHQIKVGATNSIKPDIMLRLEDKNVLVLELKDPNLGFSHRYSEQLFSYMRQLKLNVGILIGKSLQVYYDVPTDYENPVKVYETEFIKDNQEAQNFIELLEKINFDKVKLESYCEEKLNMINDKNMVNEIIDSLKENADKRVKTLLLDSLKEEFDEEIIKDVLDNIEISIKKKSDVEVQKTYNNNFESFSQNTIEKLPIEFIPSDEKLFKDLLLQKKKAIEEFHYQDGHIEKREWKAENFSEDSNLRNNIRSRPYARKGKWKQRGIIKVVFKIN